MRAVVIGAGHIARQHLMCLAELPHVEVVGVCDLSAAVAEAAAERFRVPRFYTDHRRMLEEIVPDVAHVTTPPATHFPLAMDALDAGAHVLVEKPITVTYAEWTQLRERGRQVNRAVLEDYNYLFDKSVQQILSLIESGEFGLVTHVEVMICLDILAPGSRFADRNLPHPTLKQRGGAIADFLTHLAYLAHAFVGPHKSVRSLWSKRDPSTPLLHDEFRAMIDAERGTAFLAFSAHTQPDVFWLRVYGTKMRAAANLFEPRLTIDRLRSGPRPLIPLRNGLQEARDVRRAALGGLWRKLGGGPGTYEGLWELLRRIYRALSSHTALPVTIETIDEVACLIADISEQAGS